MYVKGRHISSALSIAHFTLFSNGSSLVGGNPALMTSESGCFPGAGSRGFCLLSALPSCLVSSLSTCCPNPIFRGWPLSCGKAWDASARSRSALGSRICPRSLALWMDFSRLSALGANIQRTWHGFLQVLLPCSQPALVDSPECPRSISQLPDLFLSSEGQLASGRMEGLSVGKWSFFGQFIPSSLYLPEFPHTLSVNGTLPHFPELWWKFFSFSVCFCLFMTIWGSKLHGARWYIEP